jgi:hypothetical protein
MPDRGMAGRPFSLDAEAVRDPPIRPWALTRGSPYRQVRPTTVPISSRNPSSALSRVSASRMPIGGEIARCSITARCAMLAAISGYWTGRF